MVPTLSPVGPPPMLQIASIMGERYFLWEEFDTAMFPHSFRSVHPDFIVSILVHAWAHIPPQFTMVGEGGGPLGSVHMDDSSNPQWGQWGGVKVKGPEDLCVS